MSPTLYSSEEHVTIKNEGYHYKSFTAERHLAAKDPQYITKFDLPMATLSKQNFAYLFCNQTGFL